MEGRLRPRRRPRAPGHLQQQGDRRPVLQQGSHRLAETDWPSRWTPTRTALTPRPPRPAPSTCPRPCRQWYIRPYIRARPGRPYRGIQDLLEPRLLDAGRRRGLRQGRSRRCGRHQLLHRRHRRGHQSRVHGDVQRRQGGHLHLHLRWQLRSRHRCPQRPLGGHGGRVTHDTGYRTTVTLGNGKAYEGVGISVDAAPYAPLVDAVKAAKSGVNAARAEGCEPGALDPAKVNDAIVLCKRNDRVSAEVKAAGGAGMVLYNTNAAQDEFANPRPLPSVHVDKATGDALKAYASGPGATAGLSAARAVKLQAPQKSCGPCCATDGATNPYPVTNAA
ncbi:hypothetical protein F3K24_43215 [Streptomyces sp. LBUM 1485]|nr:hypothetical protein [Streptomyces sp. LBUM 1485]